MIYERDNISIADTEMYVKLQQLDNTMIYISDVVYIKEGDTLEDHRQYAGITIIKNNKIIGYLVLTINHNELMKDIEFLSKDSDASLFHIDPEGHILYNKFLTDTSGEHNFDDIYPDILPSFRVVGRRVKIDEDKNLFIKVNTDLVFPLEIKDDIIYQDILSKIVLVYEKHVKHGYTEVSEPLNVFREINLELIFAALLSIMVSYFTIHGRYTRKYEFMRLKHIAEIDDQTHAYTRRAGKEIIRSCVKDFDLISNFSLCFLDVNGLKEINDTFGHKYGDKLIVEVAEVILQTIRKSDFLIRFGGDEFLIVLPNEDINAAGRTWEKISETFEFINKTSSIPYNYSVSCGIVEHRVFEGQYFNSNSKKSTSYSFDDYIEALINEADSKMYKEKTDEKSKTKYKIIK
jgi:diguanylate cyclase (GGDEF)-like protein